VETAAGRLHVREKNGGQTRGGDREEGEIRTTWSCSLLSRVFKVSSSASWGEMKKWICVVESVEFWKWQAGQESPPCSPLW
jgi:hypothetical protein